MTDEAINNDEKLTCIRCGSSQVNIEKKDYVAPEGFRSFLMHGPLGFFFGQSGSDRVQKNCLKCKYTW